MNSLRPQVEAHTRQFTENRQRLPMVNMPIKAHIIRHSDGTGGLTESAFNSALDLANSYYQNANITFVHCGPVNFIDSDTYYDFEQSEQNALYSAHGEANVINLFIPGGSVTSSSGGALCGYAYFPWSSGPDFIVVAANCMASGNTFAHELGHYFGMYHTHGKVNCDLLTDELVNGSNCSNAGDDVCDTPADPNLAGVDCNSSVVSGCTYVGTLTDANGQAYNPDVSNIMSYAPHGCRTSFSSNQYARANFYALTARDYLFCSFSDANASCAQAGQITGDGTYSADGPLSGNGCHNCSGGAAHADWFYFDAPENGTITASSCNYGTDTRLWVYQGSCSNLTLVGSGDDECPLFPGGDEYATEVAGLAVTGGNRYYLEWDDHWSSDPFDFDFSFTPSCDPPTTGSMSVVGLGYSWFNLDWADVADADEYQSRTRVSGAATWEDGGWYTSSGVIWVNRDPCSTYEVQVRSRCGGVDGNFSNSFFIDMQGCGDPYCYAYGRSWDFWIDGVGLSNLFNGSGQDYGYANYTNLTADVEQGQSYSITLNPGSSAAAEDIFWHVWIDYNQDGDFSDAGEQAVQLQGSNLSPSTANITIPATAPLGPTRMRVMMDRDGFTGPCATNGYREVEDYTLNIDPLPCEAPTGLAAIATGYAYFELAWNPVGNATAYQTRIRVQGQTDWNEGNWYSSAGVYWGNLEPCTTYEVQVHADCGGPYSAYSSTLLATTVGCGAPYCYSYGLTWDDWIAGVQFGDIANSTGKDFGYGDYTFLSTDVEAGSAYPISLQPATDDNPETTYWRIWIDFNQDNDFEDPGEMVFQAEGNNQAPVGGSLSIPTTATTGSTTMRISMDINGFPGPCDVYGYREVEDYSLNITPFSFLNLSTTDIVLPAEAGAFDFTITSNIDWSLSDDALWFSLAPENGAGTGVITITHDENTGQSSRAGLITVTGTGVPPQDINVTQLGAEPYLSASPMTITVGPDAGQASVSIVSNIGWQAIENASWMDVSPTSGADNGSLLITYSENTGAGSRQADIVLRTNELPDQTVSLIQEGLAGTLTVSPASQLVGAGGGCVGLSLTANVPWTASYSAGWISSVQPSAGNGNATVTVCYQANGGAGSRMADILFSGGGSSAQASITQSGNQPNLPPWPVIPTGSNHIIIVPTTLQSDIGGQPLSPDDWIGFFYDDNGTEVCAGYGQWDPAGNGSFAVYGDDAQTPLKDGFAAGEEFKVKVWVAATAGEVAVMATYAPPNGIISSQGNYEDDGISQLESLESIEVGAPWPVNPTGSNHIIIVPSSLQSDINGQGLAEEDWIGFFYEDNGTAVCAGAGQWRATGNQSFPVFGDDAQTPQKDGFAAGEPFRVRVWVAAEGVEYDVQATYAPPNAIISHTGFYADDGISQLLGLSNSGATSLAIDLLEGWNMISSYVEPDEPDMEVVFQDIVGDVIIIKDAAGNSAIPAFGINNIGDWDIVKGYKVKMQSDATLEVNGAKANPAATPIPISQGWQIIAYLRDSPSAVAAEMAPIASDIILLKDNLGNAYIPTLGIDNIGSLRPTQGYQLKASAAATLTYSGNMRRSGGAGIAIPSLPAGGQHFNRQFLNTGHNATLVIPSAAGSGWLQGGDELGIFNESGALCGAAVYSGANLAVTLWGDDPSTEGLAEGLLPGEEFHLRRWRPAGRQEEAFAIQLAEGAPAYAHDGLYVLQGATPLVRIEEKQEEPELELHCFPNPAGSRLNLRIFSPKGGSLSLTARGMNGATVYREPIPASGSGWQELLLNVENWPAGLYQLSVRCGGGAVHQRFVKR